MSFEIRINGTPFRLWKSATVQRSIEANAGAFRFSNSTSSPIGFYSVKTGDFVEIMINGKRKIAGFVDEISGSHDDNGHTIEVSGRDNVADLIDSSVPDSVKVIKGPISLKSLIEGVAGAIGAQIKITSQVAGLADFDGEEIQAAGSGQTCMAYLVSFARKRQVYLVPDGAGGLVIYRPDKSNQAKTPLIHKVGSNRNNVLASSFRFSLQNRFSQYLCRSQDNFGFSAIADYFGDGTDRSAIAIDGQIRASRYREFQAEQAMGKKTCAQRAAEEANIRRAQGTTYTVSVPGAAQADGTLWDFGQFVTVQDDYSGITGSHLIQAVEYAIDIDGGTRTQLTLVPPDAYQVTAEPLPENKRNAKTGQAYQNQTPQSQGLIR